MQAIRSADSSGNMPDELYPFFGVQTTDSVSLRAGRVSNGLRGSDRTITYGPDSPVLLDAGTYKIDAWLATLDGGQTGPPPDTCSTEIDVRASENVWLAADFQSGQPVHVPRRSTPEDPG